MKIFKIVQRLVIGSTFYIEAKSKADARRRLVGKISSEVYEAIQNADEETESITILSVEALP